MQTLVRKRSAFDVSITLKDEIKSTQQELHNKISELKNATNRIFHSKSPDLITNQIYFSGNRWKS